MNEQSETSATKAAPVYYCPKHPDTALWNVMAGGAGYCKRCIAYVQAAGVEAPQLDPVFMEKREMAMAAERKTKAQVKAKARQARKKTQLANESSADTVMR